MRRLRKLIPLLGLTLLACSDSGLSTTVADDLGGDRGGPAIAVLPEVLEFPTVGPGCSTAADVLVRNMGDEPLTVQPPFPAGERAADYEVDAPGWTLGPDAVAEFTVEFTAAGDGEHPAGLFIASDDPTRPELEVPLRGFGTSAEWFRTDDFVQTEHSAVDVLFVIDNSSSMAPEQAHVANNLAGFFQWFQDLGVDYHMGVVTTDVVQQGHAGALRSDFIHPGTPDPEAALADAIEVGENDMGLESGLRAMELALSEPVVSVDNAGFYREEAFLAVIILTDEPEQSPEDSTHYIGFLDALKGDPDRISVSAIVGDRSNGCQGVCFDTPVRAQPGDKYIDVQEAFPGIFQSICGCDFRASMEEVGLASAGIRRVFELSGTPSDATRIEVTVDGAIVTEWSFDAGANTVVFPANALPDGLSRILITYPNVGGC